MIVSFGMVLLIPLAFPVYKREMGSHMYSATAYYFASTLSNMCIYFFYPLVCSCLTFPFYKFRDHDFQAFMYWLLISGCMALAGLCYGQVIGTFIKDDYTALTWLLQSLTIYCLGAGLMVNNASENWFGKFLEYISPLRFGNELGLRRLLTDRDKIDDYILDYFGFTWGETTCYLALIAYSMFFFLLGWVIMVYK